MSIVLLILESNQIECIIIRYKVNQYIQKSNCNKWTGMDDIGLIVFHELGDIISTAMTGIIWTTVYEREIFLNS